MRQVTARQAYSAYMKAQIKYQERGYGSRARTINECPDCHGFGSHVYYENNGRETITICATCNNEADHPENFVRRGKKWYYKI